MNGLEAVADIGQGTRHDDAHGIFEVGLFYFVNERGLRNDAEFLREEFGLVGHTMVKGKLDGIENKQMRWIQRKLRIV